MPDPSEEQIIAFSELVAAHRSRVFGYIYAMLMNMTDAEDVYQQTTVLMWEKFEEFQPGTEFGSWAIKIAYFNVKNFKRRQSSRRMLFSDAVMEKVADSYDRLGGGGEEDRLEALSECVAKLSAKQQNLLKLRYSENLAVKQLASLEGKSEASVSMMLGRLRRTLFHCINSKLATG